MYLCYIYFLLCKLCCELKYGRPASLSTMECPLGLLCELKWVALPRQEYVGPSHVNSIFRRRGADECTSVQTQKRQTVTVHSTKPSTCELPFPLCYRSGWSGLLFRYKARYKAFSPKPSTNARIRAKTAPFVVLICNVTPTPATTGTRMVIPR